MAQESNLFSELEEKEKTSTLRTLTVLTFIGSGIVLLLGIIGFLFADTALDKALNPDPATPSFVRDMNTPEHIEMLRKNVEYKVPVLIMYLVTQTLCIFGAIKMRKLQADGYWLWLIGELLPIPVSLILFGTGGYSGIWAWLPLAINITFILLYTAQRKNLTANIQS